jgi:NAD(P)-dependent dehydrogenase (short-subunit alcohol dehydrogenase family)
MNQAPVVASTRPVAVVTGGHQGLGLGAAVELAKEGFDVALVDLHAEADPEVLGAIPTERVRYYQMDIADLDRHLPVLEAIFADFGRVDCLVNNAGIAARPLTDILELSPAAFDRSVDINLRGTFFLTQAFSNLMLADPGWGGEGTYRSIVIVSSIAAELVSVDRAQYNVTKSALSMVAKLFAVRLAKHGIHVHEIRPGLIATAMTASSGSSAPDEWVADGRVPIPRWGQKEDVGKAIAAVASGRLPYMTGQPIWVAGGMNVMQAP